MSVFEGEVQIRKIRKRGSFGGIIFSAQTVAKPTMRYVIKADYKVARRPSVFRESHTWYVKGEISSQIVTWNDGTKVKEKIITPEVIHFVKASSENLKHLLANAPEFKGISEINAEKLITFFGDELVEIALNNDIKRLTKIIGVTLAQRLIDGLKSYEELSALSLLDELGVPAHVGSSVIKIWGADAFKHIKKNPYFLSVFMGKLETIDAYAIDRLGMHQNSNERLIAYVKETLFNAFSSGHTCLPLSDFKYRLRRLLRVDAGLIERAISVASQSGDILITNNAMVQVKSMSIVESSVASIVNHLKEKIYSKSLTQKVSSILYTFENNVGFSLTEQQKEAVLTCCENSITLLTGGAGCGKTTVIEAICFALEQLKQTSQIILMALAGKAAQRITEATCRDAMTIAGFMHNMSPKDIRDDAVIIVDESSMVDILSLLKILKRIPKRGRVILTGDQEQLPPVGVGLGLHLLVELPLPKAHLSEIKRQSAESGIPEISHIIRNFGNVVKDIPFKMYAGKGSGVSFIECDEASIERNIVNTYQELGGNGDNNNVLILSPSKHLVGGVCNVNGLIHDKYLLGEEISFEHEEFAQFRPHVLNRTLRIGELIMYLRNDYDKGIRNGSIGKLIKQTKDDVLADFEGNEVILSLDDLQHIEHSYAMTVHKSQGSQFERVIVVIKETRNLDRHLIYTALTRAKFQVIFIGSKNTLYKALKVSKALSRNTLLSYHFEKQNY
ncbi:AAA family ATPase [Pseudoalteromonas sp. SR41-1]|uniref:AAA family ATPase n=1 Tax=Pseudoalteromonas sp. SR41-1 TaxID=2760952 RepID=UPI0015FFFD6C|nr:AAA family ATPase [Pseudoalteromonas sp. SR41-1]MBB1282474.1 AAA family ATPase [Pseudoalteromonas sp. SR41-1]